MVNRTFIVETHLQRLFTAYIGSISAIVSNSELVHINCKQCHAIENLY